MFGFDGAVTRGVAARAAFFSLLLVGGDCLFANVPNPDRHPLLTHVVPATAQGQAVRQTGRLDGSRKLNLVIHLPASDPDGLSAFLQQLQDPSSANYHRYLSVDQFTERFGPTQSDYDQVVAWANANGFTVTHTSINRHVVDVTATVDAVNQALNVSMQSYQVADADGKSTLFAPDSEPTLALPVPILKISGLDNFNPPQRRLKRGDGSSPTANVTGTGSGPNHLFLPSDMRAAYYGTGPLTGAGQIIAIFSFDGYLRSDVPFYYSALSIVSPGIPITDIPVNGYSGVCDQADGSELTTCDDGEQVLDIVNASGMAPGVSEILFYEGLSGPDILNQMATDNLAKIISCSWGSTDLGGDDVLFQEFQAQGQTFVNATGDDGAYNAKTWLPPSLNPLILQVGGTHLSTAGAGGVFLSERGWPDAGGGFYSPAGYSIPSYQLTGVVTAANEASSTLRNDPDVAAEADFDNPTVSNGTLLTSPAFGGTSFAAPRWSGFIALLNEQSVAKNDATAGFVNPALYMVGTDTSYASNFHDAKTGNNGFPATTGYDLVTGWGSPQGQTLIDTLTPPPAVAGFVVSAYPSMPSVVRGSGSTSTVSIGTPDGFSDDVTLSASNLPSGVTASFNPPTASPSAPSTLTLSATSGATVGDSMVTITGTFGGVQRSFTLKVTVGDAAMAIVPRNPFVITTQPKAKTVEQFDIGDAEGSVPLTYTIAAFASSDGSCTGALPWARTQAIGSTVSTGTTQHLLFYVNPGALAVGTYNGEACLTTNDPAQTNLVVPIVLNIVPGAVPDRIFGDGFDGTGPGTAAYVVDQPVEDDQEGSALDLAIGSYHMWNSILLDNINLYNDGGTGLSVYWYNDVISGTLKNKVGGVYDATSGSYAVLQAGDVVGPTSTFNRTVTAMANFRAGVDGYLGIAFVNSQTSQLNYGWIHIVTSSPDGFPAQVLDYGFNSTGAAVTVP